MPASVCLVYCTAEAAMQSWLVPSDYPQLQALLQLLILSDAACPTTQLEQLCVFELVVMQKMLAGLHLCPLTSEYAYVEGEHWS